jgi:hypothetical protein
VLLQEARGRAHDLNTWGKFDYTRDPLIVLVSEEKMGLDKILKKLKQLQVQRTLTKARGKKLTDWEFDKACLENKELQCTLLMAETMATFQKEYLGLSEEGAVYLKLADGNSRKVCASFRSSVPAC